VADTVEITVKLACFVRQEQRGWVSGCPSLDLFSQGDSEVEAKAALEEAIDLWLESCFERNTLARALQELGWHRFAPGTGAPGQAESIVVAPLPAGEVLGRPFGVEVKIPAYQIAALGG
jgi:predicted RNase H-like HicB family nuclease